MITPDLSKWADPAIIRADASARMLAMYEDAVRVIMAGTAAVWAVGWSVARRRPRDLARARREDRRS